MEAPALFYYHLESVEGAGYFLDCFFSGDEYCYAVVLTGFALGNSFHAFNLIEPTLGFP